MNQSPSEATFLEIFQDWRKTLRNEIVDSPFTPIEIPKETLVTRILSILKHNSKLRPDNFAVIDGFNLDAHLTSEQLHDQALSVSAFLISRGFKPGDRATTMLPNCIQLPVIHLGVWAAGGVFVGSSPAYKHYDAVYQLQDSGSSVVFTNEALLPAVLKAVEECEEVKTVVCIRSTSAPLNDVIDFNDVISAPKLEKVIEVSMDAPCVVLYSSGTTGLPKGVVHTHGTYHSNIEILRSHFQKEIYPVIGVNQVDWLQEHQIVATPAFHMLGFGLLNWWLLTGSAIIFLERLDEELYPKILSQFKPRYIFVTPPIFAFLTKHPLGVSASLESVQLVLSSAGPLSKEVSDMFFTHHPSVKYIVQGYGMTETGYSHLPILLQEGATASSGVIVSNNSQKIMIPGTNQSCEFGEWGEVCVKGPGVTVGYLNKPEATKFLFDEDGWLHTGDIGYLDDFGCLCIVDRVKEQIMVNYMHQSMRVSPAELEGILLSNCKIQDVAVIGVPYEDGGELVRAFVVKHENELSVAEVEQIVSDKLAAYKRITGGVVFLDVIPRSATGKILRRELRDRFGSCCT